MVVTYCCTCIVWFAYVISNYGTRPRHHANHQYQPISLQSEGRIWLLRTIVLLAQEKPGVKPPETCAHLSGRIVCVTPRNVGPLILTGSKPLTYFNNMDLGSTAVAAGAPNCI